jgi:hypothetical protein
MDTIHSDPHEILLSTIADYGFAIISDNGKHVVIEHGFSIEIEGENLWKLSEEGSVIAPFTDPYELCAFINRCLH